jgi:hypothetical protein
MQESGILEKDQIISDGRTIKVLIQSQKDQRSQQRIVGGNIRFVQRGNQQLNALFVVIICGGGIITSHAAEMARC